MHTKRLNLSILEHSHRRARSQPLLEDLLVALFKYRGHAVVHSTVLGESSRTDCLSNISGAARRPERRQLVNCGDSSLTFIIDTKA